ncbi:hypothetical protein SLEP1_g5250 [Rubroshorea leprosula]|uniref:Uncharacterized protein n=1 Tax=Rubroshorea leprosula TaxID=152421 RepID=A0AAV5I0X0_9ROSI|nr:hypothetical protein SLEP1_g5250 [Rubroshorea leprosula]
MQTFTYALMNQLKLEFSASLADLLQATWRSHPPRRPSSMDACNSLLLQVW